MSPAREQVALGLRAAITSLVANGIFVAVKVSAGILGNSYALIADGIESAMDIVSSVVVWGGLRISQIPADDSHHYGHGKAEPLAGMLVSLFLMLAAGIICVQSINEIRNPGGVPHPATLIVLVVVVIGKELIYRFLRHTGEKISSTSVKTDAWHHRSDALTSIAAAVGITIAWLGGEQFQTADAWAALVACAVIAFNGIRLFRGGLQEVMDAAPDLQHLEQIRTCARAVEEVLDIHHCHVRKSGLQYLVDVHVVVAGGLTVQHGHEIGHRVRRALIDADLGIREVLVHIEPDSEMDKTHCP